MQLDALVMTSGPAVEPVSTADAKTFARVEHSDDDTLIGELITAAREYAEEYTRRAFITQTWTYYLDAFPVDKMFLPKSPLQSVSSIAYVDENGDTQTLDSANYTVNTKTILGSIEPAYDTFWPAARGHTNDVVITFVAGYGASAASVPGRVKLAIKLLVAHWYDHRDAVGQGLDAADKLLDFVAARRVR